MQIKPRHILTILIAAFLLTFSVVSAAPLDTGIQFGNLTGLGSQDIRITIMAIVRIALSFIGIIAIVIILYAGFMWMTSGGNEEKIQTAKKMLVAGAIGLAIIFLSVAIATFIINALMGATGARPPGYTCEPGTCVSCQAVCNATGTGVEFEASCNGPAYCGIDPEPNCPAPPTITPKICSIEGTDGYSGVGNIPMGSSGDYVLIEGWYFGEYNATTSAVHFDSTEATVVQCSEVPMWHVRADGYGFARVAVPDLPTDETYGVSVTSATGDISPDFSFIAVLDDPEPHYACIVPNTGTNNQQGEKAEGVEFGTTDGTLLFSSEQEASYTTWTNELISQPTVPGEAVSGNTYVYDAANRQSNEVYFTVTCTEDSQCPTGCCADFMCADPDACLPGPGEECDPDDNTPLCEAGGQCQNGLSCNDSCICELPGPGDPCDADGDPANGICDPTIACDEGLTCDPTSCTCQARPIISAVTPNDGAPNNLITINGINFGTASGLFENILTNVDFEEVTPGGLPADWQRSAQRFATITSSDEEARSGERSVKITRQAGEPYPGQCNETTCANAGSVCQWNAAAQTCTYSRNDWLHPTSTPVYFVNEWLSWPNTNRTVYAQLQYNISDLDFKVGDVYLVQFYYKGYNDTPLDVRLGYTLGFLTQCLDRAGPNVDASGQCKSGHECGRENRSCCMIEGQTSCYSFLDHTNSALLRIPARPLGDPNTDTTVWNKYYAMFEYTEELKRIVDSSGNPHLYFGFNITNAPTGDGTVLYVDDFTVAKTSADGYVKFLGTSDSRDDKVAPLPAALNLMCQSYWRDREVIVAVPEEAVDGPIELFAGGGLSDRTDDDIGQKIPDFEVNDIVRPGLCQITPTTGTTGDAVELYGVNFTPNSQVYFAEARAGGQPILTETAITGVTVPAFNDSFSVGVRVKEEEHFSNPITFQYATSTTPVSCSSSTVACVQDEQLCGQGQFCDTSCTCQDKVSCDADSSTPECNPNQRACDTGFFCDNACECSPAISCDSISNTPACDPSNTYCPEGFSCDPSANCTCQRGVATNPTESTYAWSFSTITYGPTVEENCTRNNSCLKGSFSSPTPYHAAGTFDAGYRVSPARQDDGEVPIDSIVEVMFSQLMRPETINGSTVSVVKCNTGAEYEKETCGDTVAGVVSTPRLCATSPDKHCTDFRPNGGVFAQNTWYEVRLSAQNILGTTGVALTGNDPESGEYRWVFKTRNSDTLGQVECVYVDPSEQRSYRLNDLKNWHASASAVDYSCVVLNPANMSWGWSTADTEIADITSSDEEDAITISKKHDPNPPVEVTAQCTSNGQTVSGSGDLYVDFESPYVTDRFPDCGEACLNSKIGATFSRPMITSGPNAIGSAMKLHICYDDPNCQPTVQNSVHTFHAPQAHDPAESDKTYTGFVDCFDYNGDGTNDYCLVPNTYYRVVIDGTTRSADTDRPLAGLNYDRDGNKINDSYSWVFKTQEQLGLCLPEAIDVIPALQHSPKNFLIEYSARARTELGDLCSPDVGQRLNPYSWTWDWDSNAVSQAFDPDEFCTGATIADLLSNDPNRMYCDDREGLTLRNGCGNGVIELGEDCDDGNLTNGPDDTCSGIDPDEWPVGITGACLTIDDPDTGNTNYNYPVCGNGILEPTEFCERPGTPGCSSICTPTGSVDGVSLCGDGTIGAGEQCDTGELALPRCATTGQACSPNDPGACGGSPADCNFKPVSGDGCSINCLVENQETKFCRSSITNAFNYEQTCSVDEDCASSGVSCVALEDVVLSSFNGPVCGNTVVETGEECDVGSWCDDVNGVAQRCSPGFNSHCVTACQPETAFCSDGSGPCETVGTQCGPDRDNSGEPDGVCLSYGCSGSCTNSGSVFTAPGPFQIAYTKSDGTAFIQAFIEELLPKDGPLGEGELRVGNWNPSAFSVIERWPDCGEACIDAAIGLLFNMPYNRGTVSTRNVRLYECGSDETCNVVNAEKILVAVRQRQYNVPSPKADMVLVELPKTYNPYDDDGDITTPAIPTLLPNTYYRVVVLHEVVSETGQKMGNLNFNMPGHYETGGHAADNDSYSWVFKTRNDSSLCMLDSVEVVPQTLTLPEGGERATYAVIPWSAADSCSAIGQRLNPYRFDWQWDDYEIPPDRYQGAFLVQGGEAPDGCGNGFREPGEDCDPGETSDLYCTPECQLRGTSQCGGTTVSNCCGNGRVEEGEQCENPSQNIYCSNSCLWQVARFCLASGEVCPAGVANGQDCGGGRGICTQANYVASCGNGIIEPGEQCDNGQGALDDDSDGCTQYCMLAGAVPGSGAVCGDGQITHGEECDDGNLTARPHCSLTGDYCPHDIQVGQACPSGDGICLNDPRSNDGCTGFNNQGGWNCTNLTTKALCEQFNGNNVATAYGTRCYWTGTQCQTRACRIENRSLGTKVCASVATGALDFNQNPASCEEGFEAKNLSPYTGNTHWGDPACGNQIMEFGEECDDGGMCNTAADGSGDWLNCSLGEVTEECATRCVPHDGFWSDGSGPCNSVGSVCGAGASCRAGAVCISDGCTNGCFETYSSGTDGKGDPFQAVQTYDDISLINARVSLSEVNEEIRVWHRPLERIPGKGLLKVLGQADVPFQLIERQPEEGLPPMCRNVAVWAVFSGVVAQDSIPQNFIVASSTNNAVVSFRTRRMQGECNTSQQCSYDLESGNVTIGYCQSSIDCQATRVEAVQFATRTGFLDGAEEYTVDVTGIKRQDGVPVQNCAGGYCNWSFETTSNFCSCNDVGINIDPTSPGRDTTSDVFTCAGDACGSATPSPFDDDAADGNPTDKGEETLSGNQHLYEARCYYTQTGAEIPQQPLNYGNLRFDWAEVDPADLISIQYPLEAVCNVFGEGRAGTECQYVTPANKNGDSLVRASANEYYCEGNEIRCMPGTTCENGAACVERPSAYGEVDIVNFMCDNPWPPAGPNFPYRDPTINSRDFNFAMYYCRDNGVEGPAGDLPELSRTSPQLINDQSNPFGVLRNFVFPVVPDAETGQPASDALGIRILQNPDRVSTQTFFAGGYCGGVTSVSNVCSENADCSQRNIIQNPSFEDVNGRGWKVYHLPASRYSLHRPESARTGSYGAWFSTGSASNAQLVNDYGMYQYVLSPGNYTASVWVKTNQKAIFAAQNRDFATWDLLCTNSNCTYDGENGAVCNRTLGSWEQLNCNFSITEAMNVQFMVSAEQSGTEISVDDFMLAGQCVKNIPQSEGSGTQTVVDGYNAIQDGRTVYVSAANLHQSGAYTWLYTNVYLMSYNQQASAETEQIYSRILDQTGSQGAWKFNDNDSIDNSLMCDGEYHYEGTNTACSNFGRSNYDSCIRKSQTDCGASASLGCYWSNERSQCLARVCGPIYCDDDLDCPGKSCIDEKRDLQRDVKRMADLKDAQIVLSNNYRQDGTYPDLNAGTFIANLSLSIWPSWIETLSADLGYQLPVDPLNKATGCTNEQCWNEETKRTECPVDLFVYAYRYDQATKQYTLYTNFEYTGNGHWSANNPVLELPSCSNKYLNYQLTQETDLTLPPATTVCPAGIQDADQDGYCDNVDNCNPALCADPRHCYNPDQRNSDGDARGDVCDNNCAGDIDGDGICDNVDICRTVYNPANAACVAGHTARTNGQCDYDGNGIGDACDPCTDRDGDGYWDLDTGVNDPAVCQQDNCSPGSSVSLDRPKYCAGGDDRRCNVQSDCVNGGTCRQQTGRYQTFNPDQEDYDGDGIGYICDQCLDFDGDRKFDYQTTSNVRLCSNNTNRACVIDSNCGLCANEPTRSCSSNSQCRNGGVCRWNDGATCSVLLSAQLAYQWRNIYQAFHFEGCEEAPTGGAATRFDNCPGGVGGPDCKDQFNVSVSCANPAVPAWNDINNVTHENSQVDFDNDGFGDICDPQGYASSYCGDGIVDRQRQNEVCDCGTNPNSLPYGLPDGPDSGSDLDLCTSPNNVVCPLAYDSENTSCRWCNSCGDVQVAIGGGYCGDGIAQAPQEVCDGSTCNQSCTGWVENGPCSSGGYTNAAFSFEPSKQNWVSFSAGDSSAVLNLPRMSLGSDNRIYFDMTLENATPGVAVVFVNDLSGSMSNPLVPGGTSRINELKRILKIGVNKLYNDIPNVRIGLLGFSNGVVRRYTCSGDLCAAEGNAMSEAMENHINEYNADGATVIDAGLDEAKSLLDDSDAAFKVVVLMTDGVCECQSTCGYESQPYCFETDRSGKCTKDWGIYDVVYYGCNPEAEATALKNSDVKIYSAGFGSSDFSQMNLMSSNDGEGDCNHEYCYSSANDLQQIYGNIISHIIENLVIRYDIKINGKVVKQTELPYNILEPINTYPGQAIDLPDDIWSEGTPKNGYVEHTIKIDNMGPGVVTFSRPQVNYCPSCDVDGDGCWGARCNGPDTNDNDANVHPVDCHPLSEVVLGEQSIAGVKVDAPWWQKLWNWIVGIFR